jgi:prepilin-type processing-associated H-X9-DG protein
MITAMDEEARKQLASGPSLVRNSQVHAERAQTMDLPLPANPSTKQLRADLDGSRWSAKMLEGGRANEKGIFGSTEFQLDFRHTDIAEEVKGFHLEAGDWMALTGLDLLSNGFEIVGKAEAPHVAFDVYYGDTDTSPHRYMKLAGAFTSDWQKIILSGKSYSNEVLKVELSRKKDPTVNELNGTIWSVKEFTGDGKTDGGVNEGFRYELKIRNDKISIVDLDGAPVILGFKGSVQDNQVEMELTIDVPGDIEKQYIGDVAGAFGPKRNTLELTGKIFSADLNKNVDLLIGLERMTEGFERELLIARYENEAETLLQKLIEFTKSNENTLPNQLRDLEFTVHNHKRLIQNSSIRKVSYFPPSNRELNLANWSSEPVSVGYYMDMEGDSIPDKMMNFERMLLDVRGPFPSYLVVARIEHYDVRVGFELDLKSQRVFQRDLPPVGDTAALQQFNARLRASCANNMKQLGLSLKMFENESKGEFISGGWATIYPEYLVDPRVLLCPGKNGEECSYDILYPASNRRYWEEIHSELFGSGAPYDGSKIPWLIERKECGSESGGRNVYFHDGHVEFIKNEAWTERMGRFLKYSYTIR